MKILTEQIERPKLYSTVITSIGTGVAIGRSPDWSEILVAFHHEDLSSTWLSEHPEIKGNPHLWVRMEDILETRNTVASVPPTRKRKTK